MVLPGLKAERTNGQSVWTDLGLGPQLIMIANQHELLVAGSKAGQNVRLQDFCSLLNNHNFGSQALNELLVHCCACGRHANDRGFAQHLVLEIVVTGLQAPPRMTIWRWLAGWLACAIRLCFLAPGNMQSPPWTTATSNLLAGKGTQCRCMCCCALHLHVPIIPEDSFPKMRYQKQVHMAHERKAAPSCLCSHADTRPLLYSAASPLAYPDASASQHRGPICLIREGPRRLQVKRHEVQQPAAQAACACQLSTVSQIQTKCVHGCLLPSVHQLWVSGGETSTSSSSLRWLMTAVWEGVTDKHHQDVGGYGGGCMSALQLVAAPRVYMLKTTPHNLTPLEEGRV